MALLGDIGILLVPGEEVTTYRGHANVWGLREWLEFRCTDDDAVRRVIERAQKKGVLFSTNHPKSVGPPWEFPAIRASCMEVWQAPWRWYNWESLDAWSEAERRGAPHRRGRQRCHPCRRRPRTRMGPASPPPGST
jgi:hypothetical protein